MAVNCDFRRKTIKRLHVHVHVEEIEKAIPFYAGLFGAPPTVQRQDYAKWRLDEPALNFAISLAAGERGERDAKAVRGISHLGIEADDERELADIRGGFAATGSQVLNEEGISCCYAKGNKSWIQDPAGIPWEAFHSIGEAAHLKPDFPPALPAEVISGSTSESLNPGTRSARCS